MGTVGECDEHASRAGAVRSDRRSRQRKQKNVFLQNCVYAGGADPEGAVDFNARQGNFFLAGEDGVERPLFALL